MRVLHAVVLPLLIFGAGEIAFDMAAREKRAVVRQRDLRVQTRTPPSVHTKAGRRTSASRAVLTAVLENLGEAPAVEVGFQYRKRKRAEELYEKDEPWRETTLVKQTAPGEFSAEIKGLTGRAYDFRAVVKHPLITVYGDARVLPPQH